MKNKTSFQSQYKIIYMKNNITYREVFKIAQGILSWKYLYNKENDKYMYVEDNGRKEIIMDI